jgi:hypothetical protein
MYNRKSNIHFLKLKKKVIYSFFFNKYFCLPYERDCVAGWRHYREMLQAAGRDKEIQILMTEFQLCKVLERKAERDLP